ncbi:MAG: AAA family ATPase [Bosea sp. (in: a-proteobacteria)]|uniref:AAA family ATPase n=1 Tax=Bosea sp. (in: a-proteobacteria) TaxID=1871050 RepID=UPI0027330A3B|nr:AAA family ATPase [Bosea sp. (in: a-proteobacteria)]MDP3602379.1 AAA family ATPase [Bosea sp. (in: a-proteobacteria)]
MTAKSSSPRKKRAAAVTQPPAPVGLHLFDYHDVDRRLHGEGIMTSTSDEEGYAQARQRALWSRLYDDERGSWRSLLVPDAEMIARIATLDVVCPQFTAVTAWILRAATLAMASGRPLRLDPCVLLGPPGVGKTFYARRLSQAFGVATLTIPMNLVTDRGSWFSGLAPVWRASAPGKIAQLLLDSNCASPVVVIDEIEKASPINPTETPINVLHSLLERENASCFTDEFLEVPLRADHIIWIATANDLSPLPASIVDRLIAFEVTLEMGQMLAIQRSLFNEANAATGGLFDPPTDELLEQVLAQTPRAMSRLWPIAFGFACAASRRHVSRADLFQAENVLKLGRERKSRIGFLSDIAPATPAASGPAPEMSLSRD